MPRTRSKEELMGITVNSLNLSADVTAQNGESLSYRFQLVQGIKAAFDAFCQIVVVVFKRLFVYF